MSGDQRRVAPAARGRLLQAASEMFYEQGIRASGVDEIVMRAGVTKPTLYRHFTSKDELLTAVLERRHEERRAVLAAEVPARAGTPRGRLLAVFDWLGEWLVKESNRGCAFTNAAVEMVDPGHPAVAVVRRHKEWMRGLLRDLASQADLRQPDDLAAMLMLLVEGASASACILGGQEAARTAHRAAAVLVADHDGGRET